MKYTKLGNSDLNVSRICMGCMGFGDAAKGQHSWTLDEELAVHVRDGSHLGSNGFHRSADDGFSVLINYGTFHSNVLRIDSHAKEHEKHRPKSSA